MTLIQLDIDLRRFQDDLRAKVLTKAMQSLPEIIVNLVIEQFEKQMRELVASGEILRFKIGFNSGFVRATQGLSQSRQYMRIGSPDLHLPPVVLKEFTKELSN
jgi:hypothetical protein